MTITKPIYIEPQPVRITMADPGAVVYKDALRQDPCSYCGGKAGTIDHITASKGPGFRDGKGGVKVVVATGHTGGHWSNLTAACQACNTRKGNKKLLMFLVERPRVSTFVDVLTITRPSCKNPEIAPNVADGMGGLRWARHIAEWPSRGWQFLSHPLRCAVRVIGKAVGLA